LSPLFLSFLQGLSFDCLFDGVGSDAALLRRCGRLEGKESGEKGGEERGKDEGGAVLLVKVVLEVEIDLAGIVVGIDGGGEEEDGEDEESEELVHLG